MNDLRARLQAALRDALKGHDPDATRAIRSALSAIANAEAVATEAGNGTGTGPGSVGEAAPGAATVAGTIGVGAAEVARRELTGDDLQTIVTGEISSRRTAAEQYEESGRTAPADLLRREADLLERILRGD